MTKDIEPLGERVKTGIAMGAAFSVFVPLILLMGLLGRSWIVDLGRAAPNMTHIGILALTYPLGAFVTGILFFTIAPLLPGMILKGLWGCIAMLPWMAGIALAMDYGWVVWTGLHTGITVAMSLLGLALAWGAYGDDPRSHRYREVRRSIRNRKR